MTRYAAISDIHSNFVAFSAVLEQIDAEGVDQTICAGDLVGYNSQPNQVVDEIRRRGIVCIRGNHEDAVIFPAMENRMNYLAAEAVRWTRRQLTYENSRFIGLLEPSLHTAEISVYHGSPLDPYQYVFEEMVDERLALASATPVTVLGHTHIPFIRERAGRKVINPGSVGQPRDGDVRSSFAIIDESRVEIKRVPYDIEAIVKSNMDAGLPSALSERLRWGV